MGAKKGLIKHLDEIGNSFGVLKLQNVYREENRTFYIFNCNECGRERSADIGYVKRKPPQKCNCIASKKASISGKLGKRFAIQSERLYQIWENMKQRCNNPKSRNYSKYGGRGIVYCSEWEKYSNFEEWAIENGYAEHLTLNRVENDGNYCPENCNWITNFEQQSNTGKNVKFTFNGETLHISEWARRIGTDRTTMRIRFQRWGVEKALTTPVKSKQSCSIA